MDPTMQSFQQQNALAQALLAGSMQRPQGQMVSGHYVGPGLGTLMPLVQAFAGTRLAGQAQEGAKVYEEQQRASLGQDAQNYVKLLQGSPGVPMGPATETGEMGGPTGAVQADPQAALVAALSSRHAPLQQAGAAQLAQLIGPKTPETFSNPVTERGAEGALISVRYGDRGGRQVVHGAVPYEKPMSVADRVIDPAAPGKPLADYSVTGGEVFKRDGDLYQRMSDGTWKKLDNAPKVNVSPQTNVTVNGQKAGFAEWSKLAAKTVSEMADGARGSVKLLSTLNQLESSGKAGIFSGPTADAATFLSGLAVSLGLPADKAKLANSQTFNGAAIAAWQDMIAAAGGNRGVVKEEAQRIAQMVPQMSQTPQGRAQITAYLRGVAERNIADARQAQTEYSKALQAEDTSHFTFGLASAELPNTTPMPSPPGSTSGAPTITKRGW